jgi:hypothetical protein
MARKFLYKLHALISNYASNQVTHMLYSGLGWTVVGNIDTAGAAGNLSSIASNVQGSRVLFASYFGSSVVPLNYSGGTWIAGSPIVVPSGGGNISSVTVSDDGLHALATGDFAVGVTPFEFNIGTGLWEVKPIVLVPSGGSLGFDSIRITRDGLRALVVPKYDDVAWPLARNPITNAWTVGSSISLNASNERFFAIGISQDSNVAIVGSNLSGVNSDGLIWNGTTWDRTSVPATLASASWRPDGLSAIGGNGEGEAGAIRTVNFDPISKTFTAGQTLTGFSNVGTVTVANDGVGDIALASDFSGNAVVPLTYSRGTGLWSAGTPITSVLFTNPSTSIVFPVWDA